MKIQRYTHNMKCRTYLLVVALCTLRSFIFVSSQWEKISTANTGPKPRRGHTLTTWPNGAQYIRDNSTRPISDSNEVLIIFGGRSQYFASCAYNNGWDNETCGDHFASPLIDTSIVLSSSSVDYPNCSQNCSDNGWCHYQETIDDSYCICYDDYRGTNCQLREFQDDEYDIWMLDAGTLSWTRRELSTKLYT